MNSRIRLPLYIFFKSWLCCCSLPAVAVQQLSELEIVIDTVTNTTIIFSLATKSTGLVATLVTRFLYVLDLN